MSLVAADRRVCDDSCRGLAGALGTSGWTVRRLASEGKEYGCCSLGCPLRSLSWPGVRRSWGWEAEARRCDRSTALPLLPLGGIEGEAGSEGKGYGCPRLVCPPSRLSWPDARPTRWGCMADASGCDRSTALPLLPLEGVAGEAVERAGSEGKGYGCPWLVCPPSRLSWPDARPTRWGCEAGAPGRGSSVAPPLPPPPPRGADE